MGHNLEDTNEGQVKRNCRLERSLSRRLSACQGIILIACLFLVLPTLVRAHEDTQTHARLSMGSLLFLDQVAPQDGALFNTSARTLVRQGTIDEDDCPNYVNHFFNPKTGLNSTGGEYIARLQPQCPDRFPIEAQQTAPERAGRFWMMALQDYRSGDQNEAFHKLGRVMHLLQDMTSPAHIHDDFHGKASGTCENDGDDFEMWGFCTDIGINAIQDYVRYTSVTDSQIRPKLAIGLDLIFDNLPQRATPRSGDANIAYSYVRELADKVYDFTTFQVKLVDTPRLFQNDPGEGELKAMFPALVEAGGQWNIPGIGFSIGECNIVQQNQEWWMMVGEGEGCSESNQSDPLPGTHVVQGFAYIENIGGGSGREQDVPDNVYPAQFDRPWYIKRYGSKFNTGSGRQTFLRIEGDVLYPAAVAYGAGLLQEFLDGVLPPPVADAGGFYEGEVCTPVLFDASASHDPNGQIVKYEWDFDNDGVFDEATDSMLVEHTYFQEYSGLAVLRVTDNDGRIDEDQAEVLIGPDMTAPDIESVTATPNQLWPPKHKMVPVTVAVSVSDACGAHCEIVSVSSNEPDDVEGSGNASPDWKITGDLTLELRAERSGKGDGRQYRVEIQCTDDAGNSSTGVVIVSVAHDRR